MPVLILPRLVAGRTLAAGWVRRLGPIDGRRVVVNAHPLVSSTASFAGQLVRSVLVERQASVLVVVGGPDEFLADVKVAAEELAVSGRVQFAVDDPELDPEGLEN